MSPSHHLPRCHPWSAMRIPSRVPRPQDPSSPVCSANSCYRTLASDEQDCVTSVEEFAFVGAVNINDATRRPHRGATLFLFCLIYILTFFSVNHPWPWPAHNVKGGLGAIGQGPGFQHFYTEWFDFFRNILTFFVIHPWPRPAQVGQVRDGWGQPVNAVATGDVAGRHALHRRMARQLV